ncbi:MAG: glycosyltransferase family 4 protein [Bacteroidales bacterium]|nr:glycosyltransferase family 4 protein [Bacteroidales bacterium]
MKFVHVEDFIHPEAGYQVNLLSKLQVQQGHEVFVVTSELDKVPDSLTAFFGKDNIQERDEKFYQLTGVKIIRVPLLGFYSGRAIFHSKLFKVVNSLNPDVVFIHGNDTLTGMRFIRKAKKLSFPLVLDSHMLEMASTNRFHNAFTFFYKRWITPRILKNNMPLIRLVDSDYIEKHLGIPLEKSSLLSFGTDTSFFNKDEAAKHKFRQKHNISHDNFVALYAGKLDVAKGGKFLATSLQEELKTNTGQRITFIIVGNTAGDYGKEVDELLKTSKNKILRFPTQTYLNLREFYQAADLAIYPKQCSMSFFEAQSCELPVIFEDNEINTERAQFGNAITFKGGDVEDFRTKILQCAEMNKETYTKMKVAARKFICDNYDFVPIAQQFSDIMMREAETFSVTKR